MTFLVRTRNGFFSVDDAYTAEAISKDYVAALLPVTDALGLCASTTVTDSTAAHCLSQGRQIEASIQQSHRPSVERVLFLDEQHTIAAFAIQKLTAYATSRRKSSSSTATIDSCEYSTNYHESLSIAIVP
jgi:tRNA U55 pseudouridine synthase TruB